MKLIKKIFMIFLLGIILNSKSVLALNNLKQFDFNNDLIIDNNDLNMINRKYNLIGSNNGWDGKYDFNNDNTVDIYDVVKLANNYGKTIVPKPEIIDPVLRFDFGLEGPRPNYPKMLVLHHAEASNASVYDIHRWHQEYPRNWAGIGYHFYIRKDGTIYKGREENWMGAHAPGYNDKSLGVCVEGAYDKENMPEKQKKAVIALGKYLVAKYNMNEIVKHKDVTATDCPGRNYPFIEIKKSILDLHV